MENESSSYYMTEKILNAYAAGALPIYWGDRSLASKLFMDGSYVYVDPSNPQPVINEVMRLLHDPDAYRAAVSKPVFKSASAAETYPSVDLQLGSIALKNRVHRAYLHFLAGGLYKESSSRAANITFGSGTYRLRDTTGAKAGTYQWSQEGQDRVVDRLLKAKRHGFFIEIGGYDGETFSNTLFFEMRRNWTGLLVEANPYTYKQMVSKDRTCLLQSQFICLSFAPNVAWAFVSRPTSPRFLHGVMNDGNAYDSRGDALRRIRDDIGKGMDRRPACRFS